MILPYLTTEPLVVMWILINLAKSIDLVARISCSLRSFTTLAGVLFTGRAISFHTLDLSAVQIVHNQGVCIIENSK